MALVRLNKLMSQRGLCSRREADDLISRGLVIVDGLRVTDLGIKVEEMADIQLVHKALKEQSELKTIILNKPLGYVSSQPEDGYEPAIVLLSPDNCIDSQIYDARELSNLTVAGRLDIDSKGLLLFTQDGRITKKIIGSDTRAQKEYIIRVEGDVTDGALNRLRSGLELDGELLKTAGIDRLDSQLLRFTLVQGKKRQIRRMCELVGIKVVNLKRVRIGPIRLGELPEGQWRTLNQQELHQILF